ncbi:cutinase [Microthyrium microscopicum]|uniref:cutinase n=1 Tax=Microthyrium microscopicum TaxID=703497 RepID=A0A6A6TW29_9PEZI|nr:cutinase [Microthyrium microscopicum]
MKVVGAIVLATAVSALPQGSWNVDTCPDNILIVARGSIEQGNTGTVIGGPLCAGLKKKYGAKFGCQGVGTADGYPAAVGDNSKPKGTCDECISGTIKMFGKMHTKCPKANLMFMGYSQGGAIMSSAIPQLAPDVKSKVIGGVLFGSTRQTISGLTKDQFASYCGSEDSICNRVAKSGSTGSHLAYSKNGDVEKAVAFLSSKIDAAGK